MEYSFPETNFQNILKNRIEELKEKCESYPAHQKWPCEQEKIIARLEQLYDDLYGN
jgi:hypothetical protein